MANEWCGEPGRWSLVPAPKTIRQTGSNMMLPAMGRIVVVDRMLDSYGVLAMQLADDIEAAQGLRWDIAVGERWAGDIEIRQDRQVAAQGYTLDVTAAGVIIKASDADGARNGAQTLRQLIRQTAPALPIVAIEDEPAYTVRGYYLDATRGRVPTLAWLKQWADTLCLYRFNQLQLYIEHTFMFEMMSETWRGTSPLTPSDIIAFDQYCAERGIELVPSVSTFGHHYMALRTHTWRSLGEFPEDAERAYSFVERMEHHTLNITEPKSFEWSCRLIDEYMGLFRSKKFNIGADETFDLGKGRSRDEAQRRGVASMYADYVSRLCRHVSESGREPMFWGDIAIEMPQILDMLPTDVTLLNWLYDPQVDDSKVRLVAQSGAKQYVCPAVWCWNALLPRVDDAWNNISRMALYGVDHGAVGFLVTDWGDFGHVNDPRMAFVGMAYAAQCAWKPVPVEAQPQVDEALELVAFGAAAGPVIRHVRALGEQVAFGWDDAVRYLELDDGRGGLNDDVLNVVANTYDADGREGVRDASSVEQARVCLLRRMRQRLSCVDVMNSELDRQMMALAKVMPRAAGAEWLRPMLIAAQGQHLLNQWGTYMAVHLGVEVSVDDTDGMALAQALEYWCESYGQLWRQVSQESEWRRVASVVWRCADAARAVARR